MVERWMNEFLKTPLILYCL